MGSRFDNNTFQSASTDFTVVTSAASAHTVGSWVTLESALAFDTCGLLLSYSPARVSSSKWSLYHLAVDDGGGNRDVFFYAPVKARYGVQQKWSQVFIPIALAKGTKVSVAVQDDNASAIDHGVNLIPIAAAKFEGFSRMQSYGEDTAASKGKAVDCGASAHTKGSFVEFTPGTGGAEFDVRWAVLVVSNNPNGVGNAYFALDLIAHDGTNYDVIVPDISFGALGSNAYHGSWCFSFPLQVAKGTRLGMKGQAANTDATGRVLYPVLHLLG